MDKDKTIDYCADGFTDAFYALVDLLRECERLEFQPDIQIAMAIRRAQISVERAEIICGENFYRAVPELIRSGTIEGIRIGRTT